jgi:hypothetical protein
MLAWVLVDQFTARASKTSEGKLNEHLLSTGLPDRDGGP